MSAKCNSKVVIILMTDDTNHLNIVLYSPFAIVSCVHVLYRLS